MTDEIPSDLKANDLRRIADAVDERERVDWTEVAVLLRQLAKAQETTNALLERLVGQADDDFSKRAKPREIWIEYGDVSQDLLEDQEHPILSHDIAKKNAVLMDKSKAGMWRINQWGRFLTRHLIPNLPVRERAVELIGLGKRLRWGRAQPEDLWVYAARKDAWHHVRDYALRTGILDEKMAAETAATYGLDESPDTCYYCLRDKARAEQDRLEAAARVDANFEGVLTVWKMEREQTALVPVEPDFFEKVAAYIARLEASAQEEVAKDPGSSRAVMIRDELEKVVRRREYILEVRAQKEAGTWTPPPRRRTI